MDLASKLPSFGWREKLAAWRASRAEGGGSIPVRDWIHVGSAKPARLAGFDQALVWVVVALLALGMVMVYSASVALPDSPRFARYSHSHFLWRQAGFIAIGQTARKKFSFTSILRVM